jgi:hypothetical protein
MTSWLRTKQESYSHFKGISFDQPSYTLTPTITGDRLRDGNTVSMSSSLFVRDGQYDPTIVTGPMPGQNAYKFTFNNTTTPQQSSRLYYGSLTMGQTGSTEDVRRVYWNYDGVTGSPKSIVNGIWIKTPTSYGLLNGQTGIHRILGDNGSGIGQNFMNIAIGTTNGQPIIGINHAAELTGFIPTTAATYSVEWDKWYFIAVKRTTEIASSVPIGNTQTGTLTYTHYINGVQGSTITSNSWKRCSALAITWGHNASTTNAGNWSVSLAGWFVTDWDAVGAEGLAEIYRYGRIINAPVKYYDGVTWQNPIDKKVYDNSAWIDIHAAQWTGTAWDPI